MRHVFFLPVVTSIVLAITIGIAVTAVSAAEVQRIGPEELKKLIENNDPSILIVDNQPKGVYDLGHIKGAINFPWAKDIKSPGKLPMDKMLILYCDCAHAEVSTGVLGQSTSNSASCSADDESDDSTDVANQLMLKFGYKNIRVLEGGWSKWQQLGYPIEKK
jgi:3-mercaptopyruvate sulfurtransferase SseA